MDSYKASDEQVRYLNIISYSDFEIQYHLSSDHALFTRSALRVPIILMSVEKFSMIKGPRYNRAET